MADAGRGRHDAEVVEAPLAPLEERVALAVAFEVALGVDARRRASLPKASTCTEWSITRSTSTSGLIAVGSPPISSIASRIAARSTTAGTPVKSCIRTRAGWKGISTLGSAAASQEAIASTSARAHRHPVLEPQHVLQQHLDRVRQAGDVEALLQRVEAEDLVGAAADLEGRAGAEGIGGATHGTNLSGRGTGKVERGSTLVLGVAVGDRGGGPLADAAALGADRDRAG